MFVKLLGNYYKGSRLEIFICCHAKIAAAKNAPHILATRVGTIELWAEYLADRLPLQLGSMFLIQPP